MNNNLLSQNKFQPVRNYGEKEKRKNSQISNGFHWVYILGFFLILTLPVLSLAPLMHPPSWSKAILFRIIFSCLLFFFIYQILFHSLRDNFALIKKNILNRKTAIFLPFWLLAVFLLINFLSTIFSLDVHYSFWDSPYRGGGFLNLAFYIFFAIFVFLIIKHKDWQRLWDFSLIVGIFVSFVAICQKFSLFSKFIVPYPYRPVASMGGSMFLALYLLLLTFLPISFLFIAKGKKKIFYLFSFFIFLFAIFLAATRSVFLGISVGLLFFILFYPTKGLEQKTKKRALWTKALTGVFLFLVVLGVFWLQGKPEIINKLEQNDITGPAFSRAWSFTGGFSLDKIILSRGSGWQVAWEALKDRPILGYGPENFSIGFDKYYDPNLPGISKKMLESGSSGWWDKAHNFALDMAVTTGIPSLLIYLLFFIVLFWQLQKIKRPDTNTQKPDTNTLINTNDTNNDVVIAHGIQATFIAYFVASFFNFDVFSTFIILFLLIGYSFYLIFKNSKEIANSEEDNRKAVNHFKHSDAPKPWQYILIFVLFVILIWFIWSANLKPLNLNKELNKATFYATINNDCAKAITISENVLKQPSVIYNYCLLNYIDIIGICAKKNPFKKIEFNRRGLELLKESMESRSYYTRIWLYFNSYANVLLGEDKEMTPEIRENLIKEAYYAIERAHEMSPNRQEIYLSWIETCNLDGKIAEAEKLSNECIAINPEYPECWWSKALIYINQGKVEEGTEYMQIAKQNGLDIQSETTLNQLLKVYINLISQNPDPKYYRVIIDIYNDLITLNYNNFQYHASAAHAYKIIGEYEKSREEALIVLELSPESKANVEAFIQTLPYPYNQM